MNILIDFFLMLTREQTIIGLFLLGYIWIEKREFFIALSLLLFTMVYNHWLKEIFRMPLPSTLGKEGWAFPSGHMHTSAVFMGYLAWQFRENKNFGWW